MQISPLDPGDARRLSVREQMRRETEEFLARYLADPRVYYPTAYNGLPPRVGVEDLDAETGKV